MIKQYLNGAALALALATTLPAAASSFVLNFDDLADGANANGDAVALAHGVTFHEAQFVPDMDEFGDTIAGREKWQAVLGGEPISARDPNTFAGGFYGPAPSGANGLDVRDAPVLMSFATPLDLLQLSFTLDRSTLGNPFVVDVLLLGVDKQVLASIATMQSVSGYTGVLATPVFGVKEILLSTTAYYDDISVSAVQLPAPLAMLGAAVMALAAAGRRWTSPRGLRCRAPCTMPARRAGRWDAGLLAGKLRARILRTNQGVPRWAQPLYFTMSA